MLVNVFLFLCFACLKLTTSLDVSWIPSDPDGPLPLSAKYRDSLRKLCTLLNSGDKLPFELQQKRPTLVKMCKKLKSGDNNIASAAYNAFDFSSLSYFKKVVIAGIVSVGGGWVLWDKRRDIKRSLTAYLKKATGSSEKDTLRYLMDAQKAREARLKRFQEE